MESPLRAFFNSKVITQGNEHFSAEWENSIIKMNTIIVKLKT